MSLNTFQEIQIAIEQAEAKRKQGDLQGAYNSYWKILRQRLSAPLIAADLTVIQSLADLALLFGDFSAADHLLIGLVQLCETENNPLRADFARLKRLHLMLEWGKLRQADELLREMSPRIGDIHQIQISPAGLEQWEAECYWPKTNQQDRAILLAYLYLGMGRLLTALGQYGDALMLLQRGLIYSQPYAPILAQLTTFPLKLIIARACLEKGEMEAAQTQLEDLKPQLNREQYPEYYIHWLTLYGKWYLLRGEFGSALKQFQEILEICQQLGFVRAILQATLNLAHVLILLNQTSRAKDYLTAALDDVQRVQDVFLENRLKRLSLLADSRSQPLVIDQPTGYSVSGIRQRQLDKSSDETANIQHSEILPEQSPNYLSFFEDRVLDFLWQLNLDLGAAADFFSQIKQTFQFSDSQLIHTKMRILEVMLIYYQALENDGKSHPNFDALLWTEKNLKQVEITVIKLGLKPDLWQIKRIQGWCSSRLKAPVEEQKDFSEQANQLLQELTESLSAQDQAIYLLNKWTSEEEFIAFKINQMSQLKAKLKPGFFLWRPWRRWMLMQQINEIINYLETYRIKRVNQTLDEEEKDEPSETTRNLSLWQRIFNHPFRRVTLFFLVLPDRILVIRGWKFFLDFTVIYTTRLEIRNQIQKWHEVIQKKTGGRDLNPNSEELHQSQSNLSQTLNEITNTLAKRLEFSSLLEGIPRFTRALTIIPDDILHGFPFAAILDRDQYLIEHYAIAIAYQYNNTPSPPKSQHSTQKSLIVGVSQGTNDFAPLKAVPEEINLIQNWLQRHSMNYATLVDATADKTNVIQHLLEADFLHIACHGIFQHNSPEQSGLVLIPNPAQPEILSLRELSRLNLNQLYHVTLSSCWSADHFILPGRWIISLPETFWRAGTHSILGCLWEVYDPVAVSIMTQFYYYLNHLPRDEALRRTQLDCLYNRLPQCRNIDLANPIYWAGFNLFGDYRRLNLWFSR